MYYSLHKIPKNAWFLAIQGSLTHGENMETRQMAIFPSTF